MGRFSVHFQNQKVASGDLFFVYFVLFGSETESVLILKLFVHFKPDPPLDIP